MWEVWTCTLLWHLIVAADLCWTVKYPDGQSVRCCLFCSPQVNCGTVTWFQSLRCHHCLYLGRRWSNSKWRGIIYTLICGDTQRICLNWLLSVLLWWWWNTFALTGVHVWRDPVLYSCWTGSQTHILSAVWFWFARGKSKRNVWTVSTEVTIINKRPTIQEDEVHLIEAGLRWVLVLVLDLRSWRSCLYLEVR